jgi:phosphoserine phosphatase
VSTTAKPPAIPEVLSTSEFHAAVHALAPEVAVFDCDGTLWSGDAGTGFMRWTVDGGLLSRDTIDWLDDRYRAYLRGEVSELAICGEMVQIYQGLRESEMRSAAAEFFATRIEPNLFPEMLTLVRDMQASGTQIWAVSSTCNWVIEEGMRRFEIPPERILAARVAVVDGFVTHTLIDVPTDEAKVAALARAGITRPDAVFGNSIHDAAMLAIARHAFPINSSPALLQRSVQEHWPVYYPASVAPA